MICYDFYDNQIQMETNYNLCGTFNDFVSNLTHETIF